MSILKFCFFLWLQRGQWLDFQTLHSRVKFNETTAQETRRDFLVPSKNNDQKFGLIFEITQAMRSTDYVHMYKYFRTGTTDSAAKFRDFPKPILNCNIHLVYQNCSKRLLFVSMREECITSFTMPSFKRIKDLLLHLCQF